MDLVVAIARRNAVGVAAIQPVVVVQPVTLGIGEGAVDDVVARRAVDNPVAGARGNAHRLQLRRAADLCGGQPGQRDACTIGEGQDGVAGAIADGVGHGHILDRDGVAAGVGQAADIQRVDPAVGPSAQVGGRLEAGHGVRAVTIGQNDHIAQGIGAQNQGIVAGAACQGVGARTCDQAVVVGAAIQTVGVVAAVQRVGAGSAAQGIVAVLAAQAVVARAAGQAVGPAAARQGIVAIRACSAVIAAAQLQVFRAGRARDIDGRGPEDQGFDVVEGDRRGAVGQRAAFGAGGIPGAKVQRQGACHRRQVQRVARGFTCGAARDGVVAEIVGQNDGIVAVPGQNAVVAGAAGQAVVARTAGQGVVARAAGQGVVARAAVQRVGPAVCAAGQAVVSAFAKQLVIGVRAVQRVVVGAAEQGVVAQSAGQAVVAGATQHEIRAVARQHRVVARAGVDHIGIGAGGVVGVIHPVAFGVAGIARVDQVIAREASHDVIRRRGADAQGRQLLRGRDRRGRHAQQRQAGPGGEAENGVAAAIVGDNDIGGVQRCHAVRGHGAGVQLILPDVTARAVADRGREARDDVGSAAIRQDQRIDARAQGDDLDPGKGDRVGAVGHAAGFAIGGCQGQRQVGRDGGKVQLIGGVGRAFATVDGVVAETVGHGEGVVAVAARQAVGTSATGDQIVAAAAIDGIVARARRNRVGPAVAIDGIRPAAGFDQIVATTRDNGCAVGVRGGIDGVVLRGQAQFLNPGKGQGVGAVGQASGIVTGKDRRDRPAQGRGVNRIVIQARGRQRSAVDHIGAKAIGDHKGIGVGTTHHLVGTAAALQGVVAIAARQGIGAGLARQTVIALPAVQHVVALATVQRVAPGVAPQAVIAGAAGQGIGTVAAVHIQRIGRRGAVQRIPALPQNQRLDLREGDAVRAVDDGASLVAGIGGIHRTCDAAEVDHVMVGARCRGFAARDRVGAPAGGKQEQVAIGTAGQQVVVGAAVQRVGAVAAGQRVVAEFSNQRIVSRAAQHAVVFIAGPDRVVAGACVDRVVAEPADQLVGPGAAIDQVVAAFAIDGVVAVVARDRIVAVEGPDQVGAIAADNAVVARIGIDGIGTRPGDDRVVQRIAVDQVGIGAAVQRVVAQAAAQGVRAVAACQVAGKGAAAGDAVVAVAGHDGQRLPRVGRIQRIVSGAQQECFDIRNGCGVGAIAERGLRRAGIDDGQIAGQQGGIQRVGVQPGGDRLEPVDGVGTKAVGQNEQVGIGAALHQFGTDRADQRVVAIDAIEACIAAAAHD